MKPDEIKSNLKISNNCVILEVLEYINELEADNERLNKKVEELSEVLSDSIKVKAKEIKSEAIREFAERLKDNMNDVARVEYGSGDYYYMIGKSLIDNIVKEMVGEGI